MTRSSTFWLVVQREYKAWRKPFLISTALISVGVIALLVITTALRGGDDTPEFAVGTVGDVSAALGADLQNEFGLDAAVSVESMPTVAAAESALEDGSVDAVVVGRAEVLYGPASWDWLLDTIYIVLATDTTQARARELGLSDADVARLSNPGIRFRSIEIVDESSEANEVVGTVAAILMFMAIISYGQWIGYAVVEEKSSRVVELLLGAVRPHHLMAAKVVSIGSLGLAQIGLVGGLVIGFGLVTDRLDLPPVTGWAVFWVMLWFFLGYALYGCLYAAGGSIASNSQEAGNTFGPLSMVLAVGYIAALINMDSVTDTVALRVMSFVPLWAPLTMPARIVRGWAAWWEVGLSLALMIGFTYLVIRVAGRVYQGGVARGARKLGWREAWRSSSDVVAS